MSPAIFNSLSDHAWQVASALRPHMTIRWYTCWDEIVPSITMDMQESLMDFLESIPGKVFIL